MLPFIQAERAMEALKNKVQRLASAKIFLCKNSFQLLYVPPTRTQISKTNAKEHARTIRFKSSSKICSF
jgi:hypothetical protein